MTKYIRTGDFLGAFADGAILFPLVAALSITNGFSGTYLFASAGLAYIVSGFIFRVPMPVQPLKSVAIAAVAAGASSLEVRWACGLLGVIFLLVSMLDVDAIARKIPVVLIHGVQAALGLMLLQRGLSALISSEPNLIMNLIPIFVIAAIIWAPNFMGINLMGIVATLGIIMAVFWGGSISAPSSGSRPLALDHIRIPMILALVLPQLALSLANSVVATKDVCYRYFGPAAHRVTLRNLLLSIGAGNVLMSIFGGLPFCHGAGGLTAHYRAGARNWWMNHVIGSFLLVLAAVQYYHGQLAISIPAGLLAVLLISTGFFHLKLAAQSWATSAGHLRQKLGVQYKAL